MTARSRQLLACALLLVAAVAMLMLLNYAKFSSTFEHRTRDRHGIVADNLADALEAQLALGLTIMDTPALRTVLERGMAHDSSILAIAALDVRGSPSVVIGQGRPELWRAVREKPSQKGKPNYAREAGSAAVAMPLRNAFDVEAGWLVLEYDMADTVEQTHRAFAALWPAGLLSLVAALVLLALFGKQLLAEGTVDNVRDGRRLTVLVTVLLLLVQCVFAWNTYQAFNRITSDNAPMLGATLAQTVRPGLDRALNYGIPLSELKGIEEWLSANLSAAPEFNAIRILDKDHHALFHSSSTPGGARDLTQSPLAEYNFPLQKEGIDVGQLHVSLDLQALAERSHQLAIEFITLLIIGAILSSEILRAIHTKHGQDTPDDQLKLLRLPLFLFFLSSELPRSFLPIWSNELASRLLPEAWRGSVLDAWFAPLAVFPETVLAAVPISAYLLSMALASPFAGKYCARHGSRRLLLLSIALALAGHLTALIADSLLTLCLARIIAGLSFGSASVAALDFIGRQPGGRAAGMAVYLTALVAAGICGTGLGALIVDRAGIPAVFAFGLACALVAALALRSMPLLPSSAYVPHSLGRSVVQLLSKPTFLRLVVFVTLPMQIIQQGLLFYWAPLALTALGERTSFVGLAMMGYFLMVLFLNGLSARLADRTDSHNPMVVGGLLLAAAASVIGGLFHYPLVIGAVVLLIGVAWAASFSSQGALALRLSHSQLGGIDPAIVIGVYRTIERAGAMLAPLLVALLIVAFGYAGSALIMGGILLVCALAHGLISRRTNS
jgi:predicted MFS family arabinose efflux permease